MPSPPTTYFWPSPLPGPAHVISSLPTKTPKPCHCPQTLLPINGPLLFSHYCLLPFTRPPQPPMWTTCYSTCHPELCYWPQVTKQGRLGGSWGRGGGVQRACMRGGGHACMRGGERAWMRGGERACMWPSIHSTVLNILAISDNNERPLTQKIMPPTKEESQNSKLKR